MQFRHTETSELLLPAVKRLLADPQLPGQLRDRRAGLLLTRSVRDLFLGEVLLPHDVPRVSKCQIPEKSNIPRGSGNGGRSTVRWAITAPLPRVATNDASSKARGLTRRTRSLALGSLAQREPPFVDVARWH